MGRWSHLPLGVRILVRLLRPVFMLLTTRDWRGFDKLPKDDGYVIAANHVSHLDPFLFAHALVDNGIVPRFLGKDTLWRYPILGWIVRNAEQIPVYRGTAGAAESLRAAIETVNDGRPVVIYPEGTITRDPGMWPMTGRTGAVRVALMTGKPLFPVMQWGANEILAPYAKIPAIIGRKTIHVWVGDQLDLSAYAGRNLTEDALHAATDKLMDAITDLQVELRGTHPVGDRLEVRSLAKARTNFPEGTDG